MRFLCQVPSDMEVYYVSSGDRFAAQIDSAEGRCPPICRLVFWYTSFHIWHCKLHMNDEISVLGELAIMRHDFDSLASGLREQHAVDRV